MSSCDLTVVGIDVGRKQKGFHVVTLRNSHIIAINRDSSPSSLVDWYIDLAARIVAVDAPCEWSLAGS